MSDQFVTIQSALISVSDKTGIVEFARGLTDRGIKLLSTGGTCRLLGENNIPVIEVSDYTGFPEMMDGRVKTLHPKIHGGILGRRGQDDAVMAEHGIDAIDMVVVNLYPFQQTVANPDCTLPDAIENIDIGGPTMVRAAAKNHAHVAVVVNADNYASLLNEMAANNGALSSAARFDLAVAAFEHTAAYDGAIANYLGSRLPAADKGDEADVNNSIEDNFPRTWNLQFKKSQVMRYGENPHQRSAFYIEDQSQADKPTSNSIATAVQLQGKALSYNNIADTDAALECVKQYDEPTCVIVKHANPCGVATADSLLEAYEKAFATDTESAFGGIIAFNRELDGITTQSIVDQQFVEVIIAPSISDEAVAIAATKKNVRLLACGTWQGGDAAQQDDDNWDYKRVNGGLLVQDRDSAIISRSELNVVTKRAPTEAELDDLMFAWRVAKFVKSNAIIYARSLQTIGVGAGQMSRVNSARIAGIKAEQAGLDIKGSVMASDAFFPFRDGLDNAGKAGIVAVIQPGGSIRDNEVIAAADEHDIAMVFTGMRHFRH